MKTVVTGAAGFIGSNLARRLLDEGHDVLGIDCVTDYYDVAVKDDNLATLRHPNFTLLRADLNDVDLDLARVLDGAEWIFHQAGQPGVRDSWGSQFHLYVDANVRATQRLLEVSRTLGSLRRFVYASSSSVYGNAERYPTGESDRPQPVSPYGVTKLAGEHLCSLYASNFALPTVSLRYFTVYGPRQRPDMAFTRFVNAAVRGEQITIYGDGEQIRDFTYVDDVVTANLRAATVHSAPGSVYNVAGGSNISVNEVLSALAQLAEAELDVRYVRAVNGDVFRTGGSTERIATDLGWAAEVPILTGLQRQFEWALRTFTTTTAGAAH